MPFCGTKWANDFTSFFTEYLGYPKCYSIKNYHHRTIFLTSSCADCLIWSNYCIMLVVYGYSSSHTLYLRWIGPLRMTRSDVTGSDVSHLLLRKKSGMRRIYFRSGQLPVTWLASLPVAHAQNILPGQWLTSLPVTWLTPRHRYSITVNQVMVGTVKFSTYYRVCN
jgi:hypothetical protein